MLSPFYLFYPFFSQINGRWVETSRASVPTIPALSMIRQTRFRLGLESGSK